MTILTGIHGNETTGLLVLHELLRDLPQVSGTLQIIMAANPLAVIEQKRASFVDQLDVNRIFPGDIHGTMTQRIAAKLIDFLKQSGLVIDLHSFEMDTPVMGIMVNSSLNDKNKELMEIFSPRQVWVIQPNHEVEQQFGKSLSAVLNEHGIPNFALETTRAERIPIEEITTCVEGLKRVISFFMTITHPTNRAKIPFFSRTKVSAPESGIFTPHARLSQHVKKGEMLGTITLLPECKDCIVHAPHDGVVMQLMQHKFVLLGEEIAAIGTAWKRE